MEMTLTREIFTGASTGGKLAIDGQFAAYTLEPPLSPNAFGNGAVAIPCGRYRLSRYHSPRLDLDVLMLHDVPGYEYVEIHPGNFPRDTRGCILPGTFRATDQVGSSRVAFGEIIAKAFAALDAFEDVWLTVEGAP